METCMSWGKNSCSWQGMDLACMMKSCVKIKWKNVQNYDLIELLGW